MLAFFPSPSYVLVLFYWLLICEKWMLRMCPSRPLFISTVIWGCWITNRMLDRREKNMPKRFLHNESRNLELKISEVVLTTCIDETLFKLKAIPLETWGVRCQRKWHIFQLFKHTTNSNRLCFSLAPWRWTDFFCLLIHSMAVGSSELRANLLLVCDKN